MDFDEDDDEDEAQAVSAHLQEDRKLAQTHLNKLSVLNGYPEVFSLFAGERLRLRLARKPDPRRSARTAFVSGADIRDAVSGRIVATVKLDEKIRVEEQVPAFYRDDGAAYRTLVEFDTTGWPVGVLECVVYDSAGGKTEDIFVNIKPRSFDGYDLVCVLPFFTWHAYNRIGGGSFYSNSLGTLRTISTLRPLHRKGDNGIDASLVFLDAFTEGGVKWVCVDSFDLHRAALPEGRAPVMALLTHDEYWSEAMRTQINRYLRRRGVLMVAAGNTCWWQLEIEGCNLTVNKGGKGERAHWFMKDFPEERTFLSSFRFGGYAVERAKRKKDFIRHVEGLSEDEFRAAGALTVVRPKHPLFEGVTLGPGNTFGAEVPIVYREVDGIPLKPDGSVDRDWYDADEIEPQIIATGLTVTTNRYKVIDRVGVVCEADVRRGHVLNMGTFGWSLGLVQKNAAVKRIVLNAYRHCRSFARERKGRAKA
ncbi:MAG TPA: N,N-dimethylformamidase beta subunit family domain-containing protein [Rhizomicrobium sp.]|nr:N,N-dimethylformamidase beta subunit family domain-containing protein [Rhizomicrobium sp.]